MKFQVSAALMGLAATAVSAQETQTGPFILQIKGTSEASKINGFGYSCHTGAGISAMCLGASNQPDAADSGKYYFNTTGENKVGNDETGTLIWNLPVTGADGQTASESQAMGLIYQTNSNIAAASFGFSQSTLEVGFNDLGQLFLVNYVDDSKFAAAHPPTNLIPTPYYDWEVCWQYFTGYYYQSVGWKQLGAPHNPTCEPVSITQIKA